MSCPYAGAAPVAMAYVAVASGTAISSLANRLVDTGAALLLTSEALVPMVEGAFQLMETPPKRLLGDAALVAALWQLREPSPVDANFPLFILYTSGSTGKPKGIVHTHSGYQLGLCATSNTVFDLQAGLDVFFVIATPGSITGQSYMIAASLLCCVPSVRAPDRSNPKPHHKP